MSTFLLLFGASSCNNTAKQDIPKPMTKPLVWYIDGLPNWFILNHSRIIYKRWNIDYVLDGCGGSIAGMKQNKITAKILEKRHGKFWHEVITFRFIVDIEKKTVVPNSNAMDKSIIEEGVTVFRCPRS